MVAKYIAGLRALLVRRVVTILVAACIAATFIVLLVKLGPSPRLPDISKLPGMPALTGGDHPTIERCDPANHTEAMEKWKATQEKYKDLMEDKFTIAIQTYKRPKELDDTLRVLLTDKIPSLYESEHGVPVRYRKSPVNSLNQKLAPDAEFKTKAILLSDDDVYYKPGDLEFVFQTWRKFGQDRLTGALPRCASQDDGGKWNYNFCSKDADQDVYSMIITNLAFSHVSFLDYYSSDDSIMNKVRKYVDDHTNCEDIALNYIASYLTGHGQLLVQGREKYVNFEPAEGISRKPGHLEARSKCLNDFNEIFGCMPLINETAHIERGVIVL
ncbi:Glucuronyl-galactosyl-proteoglycan 4-alpha-N-acetylglucosaminyltransferase-like protein [Cladobotryum mycophilum]|uniref:Glucuronyl-galactosyl-proteoglycan 4-alpha-N-acetylglucosaminyltransferase-like protein n=1 Tax=Cladobotryum mycophilum TaxID=491253 RepID=A0ABR0SMS0_9HYPO